MSAPYSIKDRVREWQRHNYYTDDIPALYDYDGHFVFMYGTLKSGHSRHNILASHEGVRFQGVGRTVQEFELVNTTFSFPIALSYDGMVTKGAIKGELYYVPTKVILALDRLESQGVMYSRETVDVKIIRDKKGITESIPAFMYVGDTEFWRKRSYVFLDLELRNDKFGPYWWYSLEDEKETPKTMEERFGTA